MAYFYCLPNNCGEVRYREYLAGGIEYNDRGKGWAFVDGDRYTLENKVGKTPNLYHAFGIYTSMNNLPGFVACKEIAYWRTLQSRKGTDIADWEPLERQDNFIIIQGKTRNLNASVGFISQQRYEAKYMGRSTESSIIERRPSYNCSTSRAQIFGNKFVLTDVIGVDKEPDVCTLTIYKNDVIVWQAEYPECPEVRKIDSRLSDETKTVKVEKLSYLEGIEVVPFARDALNFLREPGKAEIPSHCLTIYKTFTQQSIIPFPDYYPDNEFIAQICSAPSFPPLPPPKFHVVCNCDCESCPPDTCAIACTEHVCCYDRATGKAVKEIPIDDYCGDL